MSAMHERMGMAHPKLARGRVWCKECGRSERVDSGHALASGWPTCCGYTMTIDSPEERQALAAQSEENSHEYDAS